VNQDLANLVRWMQQCEDDTRDIIGVRAAKRLAYWHQYETDLDRLVKFIHDRIHSDKSKNGWTLEQRQRLSLERIVAVHCRHLFSPSDARHARATLGLIEEPQSSN
jgi:hypothetical protein